ncbi:MAG: SulP family inorganic anion transporter [Maritimibacter sp.]|nr:SulP family inorganic anion transporter [Maritimibacter sp.]
MQPKILTTLRSYSWPDFGADALAGVTVGLVALPLSLAIAIASGATPAQGLVTAIIGGFVVSALGGSRVQIGGPTGAFIVVVYAVVAEHGMAGLILATLMAGAILVVAGVLNAGRLVAFVPEPVIEGFTLGIAVIIATSQLRDFLGLDVAALPADFLEKLPVLWAARDSFAWQAPFVGLATMVLIVALRRFAPPKVPGLIFAVVLGSALALVPGLGVDTIGSRFGALPRSLPAPALPEMSLGLVRELLPSALVIAFLAGVESLLSAVVADRMIGGHHRHRAELRAQGAANLASALFGGLPVTGAIARTATNVKAGGRTPVAGIVHALTILLVMLVAAPLAGHLAMPAMAALLMLTAWNMAEPGKWKGHVTGPRQDAFLIFLTMALTVLVDLTLAIGVGVALGFALRRGRRARPARDWTPREK